MEIVKQAIKYGVVGILNTLLTAAVIWVMMKCFGFPDILSNITGYVVGLLNSFFFNRQWTFHSSSGWKSSALKFGVVFGICYLFQLGVLLLLNRNLTIDPYYNQLIAMAFYMVINFIMNKFYTFKA